MRIIGGFWGRSAWGPLWEHLAKASDCVDLLRQGIESFLAQDDAKLQKLSKKISRLEKDADAIKENIRQRLTRSIFSSVQRSDVMAWLRQQDGIADCCEDIVKLFSLRKTKVPKKLQDHLKRLGAGVIKMMDNLNCGVKLFCQMSVKEYTPAEFKELSGLVADTQQGKDQVETLELEFLKVLFALEKQLDPVTIFFLVEVADKITRIADRIENVGDIIRHMVVK